MLLPSLGCYLIVAAPGVVLSVGTALNSRREAVDRRDSDVKVALLYTFSRKIGQNKKSAIVSAQRN